MPANRKSLQSGYLLLEACLGLAITALILTSVFKIMDWNLRVSQTSIEDANSHIKEEALFAFFDRAFLEMSGDAIIELNFTETSRFYLSEMTIQNSGESFSWPNQPFNSKAVKIITRPNSRNHLDIVLEYYSENLLSSPFERNATVLSDQTPVQSITLLENIARFEWQVWNGQNTNNDGEPEWEYEWNDLRQNPRYFELNTKFTLEREEIIHTFWNPRKINPSSYFLNFTNNASRNRQQAPQPAPQVAPQ